MTEPTVHKGLARLRDPFPATDYGFLPKQLKKDDTNRGKCVDTPQGRAYSADGHFCGGYHARSVHLSYVGHAALTKRLLEADEEWAWEPMAFDPTGAPVLDRNGGMWIRLTVCGVTRIGYGDAQGKTGGNAVKEVIGDALRNAAMRFGTALELWHKGELSEFAEPPEPGADDVSRETSQGGTPEPRPETPIVEAPAEPSEHDWLKELADAKDKGEVEAIYHKARSAGVLAQTVKIGRKNVELGQHIIAIGKAFAEKEAEGQMADGAPAVLADPSTGEVRE